MSDIGMQEYVPRAGNLDPDVDEFVPWGRLPLATEFSAGAMSPEEKAGVAALLAGTAGTGLAWIDIRKAPYGADPTGVTDSSPAFQAALQYLVDHGGGVLYMPGVYRLNARHKVPYIDNPGGLADHPTITIRGDGSSQPIFVSGQPELGGTRLEFYDSTAPASDEVAYIDGRARGSLNIVGLTMKNKSAASAVPFVHVTNTTLLTSDVSIVGRDGRTGTSCDQDGIVLGGLTRAISLGPNSPVQGYPPLVIGCFFNRIRTAVRCQTWCNSAKVLYCTISTLCGGSATDAPFVCDSGTETGGGLADSFNRGNLFFGNLVEMLHYKYALVLKNATTAIRFCANECWDPADYSPAYAVATMHVGCSVHITDSYRDNVGLVDDVGGGGLSTWAEGFANRLRGTTFMGADSITVNSHSVFGGGVLFQPDLSVNAKWRLSCNTMGATLAEMTWIREVAGVGDIVAQLQSANGASSTWLRLWAPVATQDIMLYGANGHTFVRAEPGYDAGIGNWTRPRAFMYLSASDMLNAQVPIQLAGYTVATLPTPGTARRQSFATNGRKVGEGAGAGTGTPVYDDGTAWRRTGDDTTVVA
jgi:hypothetical protein